MDKLKQEYHNLPNDEKLEFLNYIIEYQKYWMFTYKDIKLYYESSNYKSALLMFAASPKFRDLFKSENGKYNVYYDRCDHTKMIHCDCVSLYCIVCGHIYCYCAENLLDKDWVKIIKHTIEFRGAKIELLR